MAEKLCNQCGVVERFSTSSMCSDCVRRYRKALRRSKSDAIREYKEQPCTDCGMNYPYYVMDLDHVQGDKRFNVSSSYTSYSWKDIIDEIPGAYKDIDLVMSNQADLVKPVPALICPAPVNCVHVNAVVSSTTASVVIV